MLQLQAFVAHTGIQDKDVVRVMRESFPKYDKYLNSKVKRPDQYGIRLVNEAEQLLEEAFTQTYPKPRKPDKRRLPVRLCLRVSKTKLDRLQLAFKAYGFDTVQAGLSHIIDLQLEKWGF